MSSIRISQLNGFTGVKAEDFIPLVDSSSLTTYRVTVTSFGGWLADSGSVLSASWASASNVSVSSSWASSSISASTARGLVWPNTATASFSQNSVSASWADRAGAAITASNTVGSASWATNSKSASYAGTSSVALTASYYNVSLPSTIPPTASYSNFATSASWADASKSASWADFARSSSHAVTASYVSNTAGGGASPIAWANFVVKATNYSSNVPAFVEIGNLTNKPQILNGYNISDISWCQRTIYPDAAYDTFSLSTIDNPKGNFLVTLSSTSSNLNYCVIGTLMECDYSYNDLNSGIISFYTAGPRTNTKFTASFMRGDWNNINQMVVCNIVVYA